MRQVFPSISNTHKNQKATTLQHQLGFQKFLQDLDSTGKFQLDLLLTLQNGIPSYQCFSFGTSNEEKGNRGVGKIQ